VGVLRARTQRGVGATIAAIAAVGLAPPLSGAEITPPQQVSFDPFDGGPGQHETAVEPDSFSFADTVVAVFQVARIVSGGASGIGWATSTDGGATWSRGILPGLTQEQSPPGSSSRVSDPVVAYDRLHGVWLASVLAVRDAGTELTTSLVVSRSAGGRSWSDPIPTARDEGRFAHDKNWIVCDNGPASPRAGTCYVVWTDSATGSLALARSTDGGLSWSAATVVTTSRGSGWQPLVRPDGALVVLYETQRTIEAARSTDGGRTFGAPALVSTLRTSRIPGMRAPALPSAEVDAAGAITAAWQDCRYRPGCPSVEAPNDIVISSSPDGRRWSRTRRVPTGPELDGLQHFVPGLGVDAATSGAATRLALSFSVLRPASCTTGCNVQPYFISTADAGASWSAPEPLGVPQPTEAFPESTSGRFLGDYVSTSFVAGGISVPVFATASGASDGRFRQGVFATRVGPLAARASSVGLGVPRLTQFGRRLTVVATLAGDPVVTAVKCRATATRARLRLAASVVAGARARCTWVVTARRRVARMTGTITVTTPETEMTQRFAFRIS
jgi:hypothetical protein